MKILVLNGGSSSQKMRLYELSGDNDQPPLPLWSAEADWSHHTGHVAITWSSGSEQTTIEQEESSRPDVLRQMLLTLWQGKQPVVRHPSEIAIVGHRVVHGGAKYQQSVLLTPQVREDLRQLIPFAPLQQPANLEGIEVVERLFGSIPQAAVFDTAFHHSMPRVAQTYPGPFAWFEQGIRRYGFHGISHQYCARRSVRLIAQEHSHVRMVTCHLGNGCSLAAIRGGQSVDTTMGFTPLEGLMMGTRSGSIDPAILLYLQRQHGSTPDQIDSLLNHQSGLKGISGLSEDMRVILAASEQGNPAAQLALDLYIYRLRICLGGMIAALEGIDVLSFTGGIGEHASLVRSRLCQRFGFLGLTLDEKKNASASGDQKISTRDSAVQVLVVKAEEDWEIARSCSQIGSLQDK